MTLFYILLIVMNLPTGQPHEEAWPIHFQKKYECENQAAVYQRQHPVLAYCEPITLGND